MSSMPFGKLKLFQGNNGGNDWTRVSTDDDFNSTDDRLSVDKLITTISTFYLLTTLVGIVVSSLILHVIARRLTIFNPGARMIIVPLQWLQITLMLFVALWRMAGPWHWDIDWSVNVWSNACGATTTFCFAMQPMLTALFTVDSYWAIQRSGDYAERFTNGLVKWALMISVLVASVLSLVPMIGWGAYAYDARFGIATLYGEAGDRAALSFNIVFVLVVFIAPLGTLVFVQASLLGETRRTNRPIPVAAPDSPPLPVPAGDSIGDIVELAAVGSRRPSRSIVLSEVIIHKDNRRAAKICFLVTLCFTICWLPVCCTFVAPYFGESLLTSLWWRQLSLYMLLVNCHTNNALYALRLKSVRIEMTHFMSCVVARCCCFPTTNRTAGAQNGRGKINQPRRRRNPVGIVINALSTITERSREAYSSSNHTRGGSRSRQDERIANIEESCDE